MLTRGEQPLNGLRLLALRMGDTRPCFRGSKHIQEQGHTLTVLEVTEFQRVTILVYRFALMASNQALPQVAHIPREVRARHFEIVDFIVSSSGAEIGTPGDENSLPSIPPSVSTPLPSHRIQGDVDVFKYKHKGAGAFWLQSRNHCVILEELAAMEQM
eukprot:TRINITY_DN114924_c0_g1_i1.p2 TRINITY_DN114924_c0_g1~~TRINITY_DN114924_c0_g1_i1.p2  ORF type:complete len:158 (+),score=21.27 TRINITY_DN114924_c0_g1_i1:247-720(+)